MRKMLLRLLRLVPIALAFWGVASAQTTSTIIGVVTDASTGKAVPGVLVVATSPALQGEQTGLTDEAGIYRITLLPPGDYKLVAQIQGYKPAERSDITLRVDKTMRANLAIVPEAVQMEEQVVRTGIAPVVNVGSAESATVLPREVMTSIPVGRGFDTIARVVPGATTAGDPFGVGFSGAQSPENQYIVDGLNTTDPVFGTRSGNIAGAGTTPALLSNFYEEIDIKQSGFDAEYGRATGGMLNVVLKTGSNEYHGEVFSNFTPRMWVDPSGAVIGRDGEAIAYQTKPSEGAYDLDLGFNVGGPIMKDKLWFFAGFAPVYSKTVYQRYQRLDVLDSLGNWTGAYTTVPGSQLNIPQTRSTYEWLGKLTYLLDENNSLTASAWGVPTSTTNLLNAGFFGSPMYSTPSARTQDRTNDVTTVLGKYGGKFLDKKLIVEAQLGYYKTSETRDLKTIDGTDQLATPRMEWITTMPLTDFESVAGCNPGQCPVTNFATGGTGYYAKTETSRISGKLSAAYLLGTSFGLHNLKAGIDLERDRYTISNKTYTGQWYFLYYPSVDQIRAFRGYGYISDPSGYTNDPSLVHPAAEKSDSYTDSFAYYLQDSWRPIPDVTVNVGLRLEQQKMQSDSAPKPNGFDIGNMWAPRVGGIWDFTGQGRGKVAASWGRFYFSMPLDMGDRAFGTETQVQWRGTASNCPNWPTSFANGGAAAWDPKNANYTTCTPLVHPGSWSADFKQIGSSAAEPVDPKIEGAYVDKFGAQAEYEIISDLSLGIEWMAMRQGKVIEDMSADDGGTYFIGNPGVDRPIPNPNPTLPNPYVNSKYVTTIDPATGRSITVTFPVPERSYDGFTLKATKNFSRNWLAQASYTYSVLRGNYAGPYYPEYGQLDPGITAEYDLASLMPNKTGLLAGDQTHNFKLYGAYTFDISPAFKVVASGTYNGVSGTPVSALGAHPDYGAGSTNIIPKGSAGRTPFRNTLDLGAGAEYVIQAPYAVRFRVDVFNVFNSQTALVYDDNYTFDAVQAISGISCKGDYAGKANPGAALVAGCPAVAYLKTIEGFPVTPNPNWGRPAATTTAYQAPLSLRLSLALTF